MSATDSKDPASTSGTTPPSPPATTGTSTPLDGGGRRESGGPHFTVLAMIAVAILVVGIMIGRQATAPPAPNAAHAGHDHAARPDSSLAADGSALAKAEVWTCPMHPTIRQPNAGPCPICGMDLVLEQAEDADAGPLGPWEIRLSERAQKLAAVETTPVIRRAAAKEIRMVGTVTVDETRQSTITAWFPGRLDRLFVDYTGIAVRPGDHLVEIYSPDILAAQEELLGAKRAVESLRDSAMPTVREAAAATLDASREKLRLWGLSAEQIAALEARGKAEDRVTLNAPMGGIVTHKNATEGVYVQTGTPIYQIADLTQVWVRLDAYESDLAWLRYGQSVSFEAEAYPGETFTGRVAFIDPMLNPATRTVKLRVNVANEDGRLKPGLFVRARVEAMLAGGGRVLDPALAGKWISPMHPEIVKDGPGPCDVCGMPLVKAETLGYVDADAAAGTLPLTIPASAALLTGPRAVVYVEAPGEPGRYAGREVTLGPKVGDAYIVAAGLEEGERVVSHAAFRIDSELQIRAKTSMMNPNADSATLGVTKGDAQGKIIASPAVGSPYVTRLMDMTVATYAAIGSGLSRDNLLTAQNGAEAMRRILSAFEAEKLPESERVQLVARRDELAALATTLQAAKDLTAARESFALLSESLAAMVRRYGGGESSPVYQMHCPMAFDDRGADWLQTRPELENPYFGAMMFRCGEVVETLFTPQKAGTDGAGATEKPADGAAGAVDHTGHDHE